ncbi:hypothetical protein BsWGS_17560 [Bradybaena similaris]
MRQTCLLVVLVVAAVFLVNVRCLEEVTTSPAPKQNATYWVTTSNTFWRGRPFQLVVQILAGYGPVSVSLSITYQKYEENSTKRTLFTSTATDVYPGEPQTLKIDIPSNLNVNEERWSGSYKIVVVGQGDIVNFKHEDYVTLQTNAISIYVVTDKGIYKPGQRVRFRALAMEPENMKVLQDPKNIYITDPKGNRIKQYLGVTGRSGVVDDTLDLAPSTPTGDWTISITTRDETVKKTFTVDQYALPKVEVVVKTPAIPLSSDTMFPITVKATYTYGQPVTHGSVSARIYHAWFLPAQAERATWRTKGKLNSNGEFTFTVSSKELINVAFLTDNYTRNLDYSQFKVEANVTEDSSQRVQTGSALMKMFTSPVSIQVVPITPSSFKPGMPYPAYVEVNKADGSSLSLQEINKLQVIFNVTYEVLIPAEEMETTTKPSPSDNTSSSFEDYDMFWFRYRRTRTKVLELDENKRTFSEAGFAYITFVLPADAVSMSLTASLTDPYISVSAYQYANAFHSPSNNYIQLSAPLTTLKVGDMITFKATATELVTLLNYQVLSKGVMVTKGTVLSPTNEGSKTLSFDLEITHAMTPSVTIIVFYLRTEDSETIPDSLTLSVDGLFQTPVSVEFDKDRVKPGESVNLVLTAKPNSTVFYQAVDKSVLLLKSGNQLTAEMVRDDLAAISFGSYPWARYMFICGWPSMNSGTTAASVFQGARVIFFTDGIFPVQSYSDIGDRIMSSMGGAAEAPSSSFMPAERVRTDFPETWIWGMAAIDRTGTATIPTTAPDTITSFIASTFSVHPEYGLSVAKDTAAVTVFRELFVSVELPPFLIRYEDFCFPASVFSYYPDSIQVFLKFDSSDQFNGSRVVRQGDSVAVVKEKMSFIDFYSDVAENDVRSTRFCFSPITTGDITLRVSALTTVPGLSDTMEQVVSVKPEGVPRSNSNPFLVNVTSGFWQTTVKISFPEQTVPDSQMLTVSLAGNIMASFSDNLGDLVRQPYGCGEQNMLNFAPNIYVLQYFISTGTVTAQIRQNAVANIIIGFQTQLKYEHGTGGFSAFGEQDKNASQWLSAFVLRCLAQATYLNTENNNSLGYDMTGVMNNTASFIISNQNENGSFRENGIVFHKEMQSGSAQGEALTAYSLIALMEYYKALGENSDHAPAVLDSARLAADYIAGHISDMTDPYDIVLTCYALHLDDHPAKNAFFDKMETMAINRDGLKYWKRENSLQETNAVYTWSASADGLSVEMAAYALMIYSLRDMDTTEGLPIVRYMIQQRGPNGGFVSTQDTVVGLQALATVMGNLYSPTEYAARLTVSYTDGNGKSQQQIAKFSKATEALLQKLYINYQNDAPSSITLTVTPDGPDRVPDLALVVVTLDYNVKDEPLDICYKMSHTVNKTSETLTLTIHIAAANENATGMSTLEVEIPAGYSVDEAQVKEKNDNANLVEYDKADKLVLYYNGDVITTEGIIATITMYRTNGALIEPRSRSYTITNYYQPNCRQTKNYFWGRDDVCDVDRNNGICRYVKDDNPEVTSQ